MNLEDDAVVLPTKKQLKELSALVNHQIDLEDRVGRLSEELKLNKTNLDKIQRGALPEMMAQLGFDALKTTEGFSVSIESGIDASIKVSDRPAAFKWLHKTGNASIIKTELKLTFTGQDKVKLETALKVLDKGNLQYGINEGVHSMTLRAFVRTELEDGKVIDDSITVFEFKTAKISK